MPPVEKRPFSLSIKTANDRVVVMYPDSTGVIASLDVFDPTKAGDGLSSNQMNEELRGDVQASYPDEVNRIDGIQFVNNKPVKPMGEAEWNPQSAFGGSAGDQGIPAAAEGYDQNLLSDKYQLTRDKLKSGPDVAAISEDISTGFPDRPRPNLRMVRK
jgi:hypothetical protein